ncbi:MAG: FAD-dependent oxidoreductase [Candidatus Woesebacteria bacterium]|nr:FAD-dependent oxidoreductase [Candidatus Woesebacteria bacterium]
MRAVDYLVVGGGICGTTAAETLRRLDPDASIELVSREKHRLYSRVLLPHFVIGKIPRGKVFLRPADHFEGKKIVFSAGLEVVALEATSRVVKLSDGEAVRYGKLLIATGAEPLALGVPGESLSGVYPFRSLEDAEAIQAALAAPAAGPRHAAVVGSSFIGLEFPQFFEHYGWTGHLILRGPRFFWRVLDEAASSLLEKKLVEHGLRVYKNAAVAALEGEAGLRGVRLADGRFIEATFAACGVGLGGAPRFAREAGLPGERGLEADEFLHTPAPDVWAAGDCALFHDFALGRRHRTPNWLNAEEQGRYAAEAMVRGSGAPYAALSSYSISVFGLPISFIGDLTDSTDSLWITRGRAADGSLRRLHLKNGLLVGAALVGAATERAAIVALIKERRALAPFAEQLADPVLDLSKL